MEHISPIILAIITLVGGGGVSVILGHLNKRYREAKQAQDIASFKETAARSQLETSKIRLESIKTESDKDDWILEKLEGVKMELHIERVDKRKMANDLAREIAGRRMSDRKLIATLSSIHQMCECGAKVPLGKVIVALEEKYDAQ